MHMIFQRQTESRTMIFVSRSSPNQRQVLSQPSLRQPSLRSAARLCLLLAVGFSGAACSPRNDVTGSIAAAPDYRERHPIVIGNAPRKLDIFALRGSNGLDLRQSDDIRAFAAEYRSAGRGVMRIGVPGGGAATQTSLASVRRALSEAGIGGGYISIVHYQPDDPSAVAPIRLSFEKLQARVDSLCGQWWKDINGAGTSETFRNQSHSNFGCAYQTAIAAQVANPIDLDRPRQETPIDVLKRSKDIDTLRQHKDPSTEWKAAAGQVGSTGQ